MASFKFFSFSIFSLLLLSTTVLYVAEAEESLPKTIVLYFWDIVKGLNATISPIIGFIGKDWSFDQFGIGVTERADLARPAYKMRAGLHDPSRGLAGRPIFFF